MIGIEEYAFVLGSKVRTVEEIASFLSQKQHNDMRNIGLDCVSTDNERILWDMVEEVYSKITVKPDVILIAHSLPFIRGNETSIRFVGDVPVFFLSGLPCAIMHKAVEVAVQLISAKAHQKVLVIGADKAYSDKERVFFGTIMGDGVVALLISEHVKENFILGNKVSTTVYASDGENSAPEDIAEFRLKNAIMMRDAIKSLLLFNHLKEVDYFVTHTSNRTFWDVMAGLLDYPRDRFLDSNIRNTGHMNSHDSFYHYIYWCKQGVIRTGDVVMLINPGFGGTQGATLIKK